MAIFKRKPQANVPVEIQEYYQTERRERAGVAWLLALGTLVMTVVLAAAIFYGGRWAYRAAFVKDKPTQIAGVDQKQDDKPEEKPVQNPTTDDKNKTPSSTPAPTQNQGTTPAPQPTPTPTPTPAPSPTPTPVGTPGHTQGTQSAPLPGTGPAEVIGVFVAVTLAGYIVGRLMPLQKR